MVGVAMDGTGVTVFRAWHDHVPSQNMRPAPLRPSSGAPDPGGGRRTALLRRARVPFHEGRAGARYVDVRRAGDALGQSRQVIGRRWLPSVAYVERADPWPVVHDADAETWVWLHVSWIGTDVSAERTYCLLDGPLIPGNGIRGNGLADRP